MFMKPVSFTVHSFIKCKYSTLTSFCQTALCCVRFRAWVYENKKVKNVGGTASIWFKAYVCMCPSTKMSLLLDVWKKRKQMRCTLHCILSGVLVNKRLIQTAKIQKPVHFDRKQFDAAHANTHTVTFKLTGANSPSGYLRAFQSPPVQSS